MDNGNDEIFTKHTQMFRIHSEITAVLFHLKNLEEKCSNFLLQSKGLLLYLVKNQQQKISCLDVFMAFKM